MLILNVGFGQHSRRKAGQWVQPQLSEIKMFPPKNKIKKIKKEGGTFCGVPFTHSALLKLDYLQKQREQAALLQQTSPRWVSVSYLTISNIVRALLIVFFQTNLNHLFCHFNAGTKGNVIHRCVIKGKAEMLRKETCFFVAV